MKTFLYILIILVFIATFVFSCETVASSDDEDIVDFIIVLDDSGSMRDSDPEELALDGAKLFIDLLPAGKSNIGVILYGKDAKTIVSITDVVAANKKEIIKNTIEKNISYNNKMTNYGGALDLAVNNLIEAGSKKAAILLFTDGNLEVKKADKEEVENKLDQTIVFCNNKGWPIYTIGLNFDGTVDNHSLEKISLGTDAGNPLITGEPQDLSTFFSEIFKRYYKNIQPLETIEVNSGKAFYNIGIPKMVLETSIVINGVGTETETILKNPNGNTIEFDNEAYSKYEGQTYIVLKLIEPASGNWNLELAGIDSLLKQISIQSINVVDLPAVLKVSSDEIYINQSALLEANLLYKGNEVIDESYYKEVNAVIYVKNGSSNKVKSYPMTFSGTALCSEIVFENTGEYVISANIVTPYFERESNEIKILVKNHSPVIKKELENFDMRIGTDYKLYMSEYFEDPDNNALSYEVEVSDLSILAATLHQDVLYIEAIGEVGKSSVKIIATDSEGEKIQQSFYVSAVNTPPMVEKQMGDTYLIIGEDYTVNLEQYFSDPDGFPFTVYVETDDTKDIIISKCINNVLYIKGVKTGKVNIKLIMTDSSNESIELSGKIIFLTVFGYWWTKFWFVFLLIFVISLLFVFISRRVRGGFKVQLQINGEWLESYDVATGSRYVQNPCLRKSQFTLKPLIDVYSQMSRWFDEKEISESLLEYDITKIRIISPVIGKKVKIKAKNEIHLKFIEHEGKEKKLKSCKLNYNDSVVVVFDEIKETMIKLTYFK